MRQIQGGGSVQEGLGMAKAGRGLGMAITILYGALLLCYLIFVVGSMFYSAFQG